MRALVVYCHPQDSSFTAAVRDTVIDRLKNGGVEMRLHDLYRDGFQPVMTRQEFDGYLNYPANRVPVESYVRDLEWCDTLVFIYPTWWYGLPAMLKGWLDRVLLPDVAFKMPTPDSKNIKPGLGHITRLGVFTTCGASRWLTWTIGSPGKRTLMRGLGLVLAPRARRLFTAHFLMDSAERPELEVYLRKVAARTDKLIGARHTAQLNEATTQ
ncbi:MAG: NAD(P)H-dependent oxidoreductase [Pseudomonadota bacterium]